ncbi:hypothetical protein HAP47_0026710 [Bradyrhizobium sp. 41S5]|uniref:hypothetical protein n=1 Tax=Bradyrhizobium sp. 41S5 TaxID=1404443 RepID=UPI00156AC66A|nr:hypothetical protein [Bradyrhizobium sp. 41S5]UFX42805.1 hypothetical protein HAP47_0026710 [Bradyrhizobium sp. 41S5]
MKIRIGEGRAPWENKCSSATNRKRRIAVLVRAVLVLTNNPLLNNATNVAQCYSDLGEKGSGASIRIMGFAPRVGHLTPHLDRSCRQTKG